MLRVLSKYRSRFNVARVCPISPHRTKKRFLGTYAKLVIEGDIGIIRLDAPNSKVNVFDEGMIQELQEAIQSIISNGSLAAGVIVSSKPGNFIAGADIKMLAKCKTAQDGEYLSAEFKERLNMLENSSKPFVAAIQGSCKGGGLEMALACHYRLAVKDQHTTLGLPEVQLGLLPGGGGIQRLMRHTPLFSAIDLALTGRSLTADQAKKLNVVDQVILPLGPGLKPAKERALGVVGAGLMGAGIAHVSLENGFEVFLKDVDQQALIRGRRHVEKGLESSQKKKRISNLQKEQKMALLDCSLDYGCMKNADMVIEAVFEDLKLKHNVLRELEAVIPKHCVVASNTSALPIGSIAKASLRPEQLVGMHYFSPVEKMQLLEVITTDSTSPETAAAAVDVGLKQGKIVITVKDSPGFYTTRVLMPVIGEVIRLLQEGVDPKKLDQITKDSGFPVGSATLADEVGLDVGMHIATFMKSSFGERITGGNVDLLNDMVSHGFKGRKSGAGIFIYDGSKDRAVNVEALNLFARYALVTRVPLSDENIKMRILSRFINEAVLCLQEGIISSPLAGDVGAVFGLGFPPFSGGPFHFVDQYGIDKLLTHMKVYEEEYGLQFSPCQLLLDHSKSQKKFYTT